MVLGGRLALVPQLRTTVVDTRPATEGVAEQLHTKVSAQSVSVVRELAGATAPGVRREERTAVDHCAVVSTDIQIALHSETLSASDSTSWCACGCVCVHCVRRVVCMCVLCMCVCACVRACMHAFVRVCARACVYARSRVKALRHAYTTLYLSDIM